MARWEQLAANSTIPVRSFQGFQDLKNRNELLHLNLGKTAPQSKKPSADATDSILGDPECQEAAKKLDNLAAKDSPFLLKLAEFLRLSSQDWAMKGSYANARECRTKRDVVLAEHAGRKPKAAESNAIGDQEQLIRERTAAWKQDTENFDSETERLFEERRQKDAQELADLDEYWKSEAIEKYRKPSAELIKQRRMETEMVMKDQIDAAEYIHNSVAWLETREHAAAQAMFERDFREALEFCAARQKIDYEQYVFMRMNDRHLLLNRIAREEVILKNRLNVLYCKPDPHAPSNPLLQESVTSRPRATIDSSSHNPGLKLPMLTVGRHSSTSRASMSRTQGRPTHSKDNQGNKSATGPVKPRPDIESQYKDEEDY